MAVRFNPAPGWPEPPHPGWVPPPGWRPDPSWPEAPPQWQYIEKTGFSRTRNQVFLGLGVALLVVVPTVAGLFGLGDDSGDSSDAITVTIAGKSDDLPDADAEALADLDESVKQWNALFTPPMQELTTSNPDVVAFLASADTALDEAPDVVGAMTKDGVRIEHDGLRDLVLDRIAIYQGQVVAFRDMAAAIRNGDAAAEMAARTNLQELSTDGQELARELIEAMDEAREVASQ